MDCPFKCFTGSHHAELTSPEKKRGLIMKQIADILVRHKYTTVVPIISEVGTCFYIIKRTILAVDCWICCYVILYILNGFSSAQSLFALSKKILLGLVLLKRPFICYSHFCRLTSTTNAFFPCNVVSKN